MQAVAFAILVGVTSFAVYGFLYWRFRGKD